MFISCIAKFLVAQALIVTFAIPTTGVPQGSVLSPFTFSLMFNTFISLTTFNQDRFFFI